MTEDQILDELIRREGGSRFTNRSADNGGPTKYGITLATLREERGAYASAADVENLTEAQAREIYRRRYIRRPGFDKIKDARLREFLVDYFVNGGPVVKDFQRAVGAAPDGKIGPETLARYEASNRTEVYAAMLRSRLGWYVTCVLSDPAVKRFRASRPDTDLENLRGWMNRLGEFL